MLKQTKRLGFKGLFDFLKPRRFQYFAGLIGQSIMFTAERMFMAYVLMSLMDAMTTRNAAALRHTVIQSAVFYAVFVAAIAFPRYIWMSAIYEGMAFLRERVFLRLLRLHISYHEERHSGNAMAVLSSDMAAAEEAYRQNMMFLVDGGLEGAAAAVFMLFIDYRLALVTFASGAVSLAAGAVFARPLRVLGRTVQEQLGKMSERFSDLLAGFQVVRAFSLGRWILERFEAANSEVRESSLKRVRLEAWMSAASSFGLMSALVPMVAGAYLVFRGQASMGKLFAIVQLNQHIQYFAQAAGGALARLQSAMAGIDRIRGVLDTPEEVEGGTSAAMTAGLERAEGHPAVRFLDIDFGYNGSDTVLRGLSFDVDRGEVVALAGPSGGGKSTVLKLLLGLYPLRSGRIEILGRPLESYSLEALRQLTAFVPQDSYLFAATVEENIAFGRPGATSGEIEAAARAAYAHDFIIELPEGYSTRVGERGARLSGGQRQRIAIARALLRDAPILLLDEATSALDTESEALVQHALERLMAGRTTLVVAHRLATIQNANRILVVDGGRIIEQGTHSELVRNNGLYASLVHMGQAKTA